MREEHRKIIVQPGVDITSVWAIPDQYLPGQSDAIILAHGAGNDMHYPFMTTFHQAFARAGLLSVKFNFPYTEQGRKVPDRPALLEQTWRAVHEAVPEPETALSRREKHGWPNRFAGGGTWPGVCGTDFSWLSAAPTQTAR
jgi:hypothetical protein